MVVLQAQVFMPNFNTVGYLLEYLFNFPFTTILFKTCRIDDFRLKFSALYLKK